MSIPSPTHFSFIPANKPPFFVIHGGKFEDNQDKKLNLTLSQITPKFLNERPYIPKTDTMFLKELKNNIQFQAFDRKNFLEKEKPQQLSWISISTPSISSPHIFQILFCIQIEDSTLNQGYIVFKCFEGKLFFDPQNPQNIKVLNEGNDIINRFEENNIRRAYYSFHNPNFIFIQTPKYFITYDSSKHKKAFIGGNDITCSTELVDFEYDSYEPPFSAFGDGSSIIIIDSTLRIIFTIENSHFSPIYHISWVPDSHYLLSSGGDGFIRVWNIDQRPNRSNLSSYGEISLNINDDVDYPILLCQPNSCGDTLKLLFSCTVKFSKLFIYDLQKKIIENEQIIPKYIKFPSSSLMWAEWSRYDPSTIVCLYTNGEFLIMSMNAQSTQIQKLFKRVSIDY